MTPPALDAYQIGWICALPIEVAAAKEMFDESFGTLDEQPKADTNSYALGRVGRHYVVIASLPDGQYGTTSAAAVAINMMRTFSRSVRIGLMVGIAGGIPSSDHDIRLGDIVVSRPEGTCGGVIQYDMGKVVQDGKFQRTGSLNSPPRSILAAVGQMRAAALADDPSYPEYIQKATQRNARTRQTFGKPDISTDQLFKIDHDHPAMAVTCDQCPSEWAEAREARQESEPQVFYGIIASGNEVIKHGATRERLRKETGALCFEMEAAGLMMDFPCVVVRGICDYADSHKTKRWQGYAALAAASYAKELLGYIPTGQVSQEILVTELCASLLDGFQEANKNLEKAFNQRERQHQEKITLALTKEQQACHQAFKTSTYEEYKNINRDRADGTCRWILDNDQYLAWQKSNHNDLLWISADPGCGKSVLAKSLIDKDLKTSASLKVCYFFFKDNNKQHKLTTALCAVLHQLFSQQPNLLSHALPSWEQNKEKIQQESEELWRILIACTSDPTFTSAVCIFDALDECRVADQVSLIKKLEAFYVEGHSLARQNPLKFLVTSRPYNDIQRHFHQATELFPCIHISGEDKNAQVHDEISLVVKLRVTELGKSLQLSSDIQNRLEAQLLSMEHRTYLWLHLAIDDIETRFQNSLEPEEESIDLIPSSVDAAYKEILNRVPSDKKADVQKILRIIIGARRPLTINEMAIALGIARGTTSETRKKPWLKKEGLAAKIRHLCGLFVFIQDSRIYLIHQTAKEFLLREGDIWSLGRSETETLLSEICISYLLSEDTNGNMNEEDSDIQGFLQYAAVYWPDHVREMPLEAELLRQKRIDQLYDTTSQRFMLWYKVFWNKTMKYHYRRVMNNIRMAAFNGHSQVVQRFIQRNRPAINNSDKDGATALHWASERGHYETVQVLLENGADVNARGGNYKYSLIAASSQGSLEIVRLLLEYGAEVDAQDDNNALEAASSRGYFEVARLLLQNGADAKAQSTSYGNILQYASFHGSVDIVQLLLEYGADVNIQGGHYGNALEAASSQGNLEIVRLLLQKGADVNAPGGIYSNTLQAGLLTNNLDIVRLLVEYGADVNAPCGYYGNILQVASSKGNRDIVRLLLEYGADINVFGSDDCNAVQVALLEGNIDVVHLLLEHGADVHAQGGIYGNILQVASFKGNIDIVQLLIERGVDVNAQGGRYETALQAAILYDHLDIVQLLLENGAVDRKEV
ncbi:hypothetical protein VHEMI08634 [[Torrubiella] hemipterigena]|uniref:Uncharacterized protein n=1 Tax=[Torrubiella] hemipterigena TaxID=1531966 RepID=A0A0A1TE22_9HYPO|nr:hypothetical protein VHEMI08634 [[Torrubiella] hemipterigena]